MVKKKQKVKPTSPEKVQHNFVFNKKNYMWMLIGIVVIIIGFALMTGTEDIYDFRKITLAPIVVLLGFVIEVYAILMKPKSTDESN